MADAVAEVKVDLGGQLWIQTVAIADLKEQDINAHVMAPAIFERLVENIRRTGRLESMPYCAQVNGQGPVEIVSGHHRIRAARKAGLTHVAVLVDKGPLTRSQIIAKQLAHNALVGADDKDLVKQLVEQITSVDDLLESGLNEDLLPTPDQFKVTLFSPHADYKWMKTTFAFLPHQVEKLDGLVKALESDTRVVCVACEDQFQPFLKAVAAYARERHILSAAVAVSALTELALEQATDLREQREAGEAQQAKPIRTGPLLSQLFGTARVPDDAAAVIRQALDTMVEADELSPKSKWLAIERWAADYLAGA